jgi:hypothetical protein
MTSFSLTISIYDNSGNNLENQRGEYIITITLSPNTGSLNTAGTSSLTSMTTSGEYTFTNLKILSLGTFKLIISSTGMTSVETSNISIINYAYSMTISSSTLTPTVNFDFTLTIAIKGEDNLSFLRSCTITITDNLSPTMLAGDNNLVTTSGSQDFIVYFKTSGSKTVTASCPETGTETSLTQTINITPAQLKLVISSFTPVNDI